LKIINSIMEDGHQNALDWYPIMGRYGDLVNQKN
jgi:hypothetical protein